MPDAPEDGVKVAKELAEELREETGVQLDREAWQSQQPENGSKEEASVWYFAFGSNMNKSVFSGRRMVKPVESCAAVLPGYRLSFNMPGMPFREPAFAGVERIPADAPGSDGALAQAVMSSPVRFTRARHRQQESPAAAPTGSGGAVEVHGVVHLITPKEWQYVLETEGAAGHSDFGYAVEEVEVETYGGRMLQAYTLVCQPKSVAFLKGREALPSQRYLSLLQVGAEEHALAPAYQRYLRELQPYQASTLRRRLGAVVMGLVFLVLVAPVFATQRLYAKATGMSSKPGAGGMRSKFMARYLHTVFALAWSLHDKLQPVLGCGCTNDGPK